MAAKEKDRREIKIVKQFLLNRVINHPGENILISKDAYETVFELVKTTIETGEGNSILIEGPRGSGKTSLVNTVLENVLATDDLRENVTIVQLNGLIHTNDRLAIIDITRQMQLENVVEDKVFGSFSENFEFLLNCMKTGNKKTSKPIIFVLEEFDLFCSHTNQTLLYNLFDVSQSPKVPVCILGLTRRLDVSSLFEKRVKSRFSSRAVFLSTENVDLPQEIRLALFKELLTIPHASNLEIRKKFSNAWNKHIASLLDKKTVKEKLSHWFYHEDDERVFRQFLTLLVSSISESHQKLQVNDFIETIEQFRKDDMIAILEGVSILELCLMIAVYHQTECHFAEPFSFPQILKRYLHFVSRSNLRVIGKPVILKAFEHLQLLGFIKSVGTTAKISKEHQLYISAVMQHVIAEAVRNYRGIPTEVSNWLNQDSTL